MIKAILGSAAGGLVAGVVALIASANSSRPAEPAWQSAAPASGAYAMPVANIPGLRTALTNAPTVVDCEPGQEAVLQQTLVDGREMARVACVTRGVPAAAAYAAPAGYYDNRPVYPQPDIVQRPAPQVAAARPRVTRVSSVQRQVESQREVEPKRSWKKTALIIGGSTGAAAGVGGLIGGKKGALIGAGIGGGAASIYEAMKRN